MTFFLIPLYAEEYNVINAGQTIFFNSSSVFSVDKQLFEKDVISQIASINIYWELYKGTSKNKTKITKNKITLSNMKIAAISLLTAGIFFLLAGGGLLAGSLVYTDYLEKNESDYDKYIAGKNLARGLFYGSMAGFGVGGICIAISIPLFIDYKPKAIKKKKK